jgi:cullin 3
MSKDNNKFVVKNKHF